MLEQHRHFNNSEEQQSLKEKRALAEESYKVQSLLREEQELDCLLGVMQEQLGRIARVDIH